MRVTKRSMKVESGNSRGETAGVFITLTRDNCMDYLGVIVMLKEQ